MAKHLLSRGVSRGLRAVLASAALAVFAAGPALAGDARLERLSTRVASLEGSAAAARKSLGMKPAALPVQTAQNQTAQASAVARMELRVSALERELRALTGRLEDTNIQMQSLKAQIDRLQSDTDFRLTTLEGGKPRKRPPQSATKSSAKRPPPAGSGSAGGNTAGNAGGNSGGAAGGNTGGNTGANTGGAQVASRPPPNSTLPEGSPMEQYRYATGFLRTGQFDDAEGNLRAFLALHGGHPLAGNAQYWLGETYYVRGRYEDAAVAFAEGFQKYPKSVKAADNLLKLGMSLSRLNKRREACTAFGEINKRYPKASSAVKQAAGSERSRLGC